MTKGSEITSQGYAWATNANVTQKIKQIWNEGDRVHLVEYADGEYFIPYGTTHRGAVKQSYTFQTSGISDWVSKNWKEGISIQYLGGGNPTGSDSSTATASRTVTNRQQYYQRYWQAFLEAEQSQRRLCGLCSKPRRLHRCNCSEPLHNLRWKQSMPCLQRTGRSYGSCLWRHVVSLQILRRKQNMPELPGTGVYHTDQPFPERSKHRLRPKRNVYSSGGNGSGSPSNSSSSRSTSTGSGVCPDCGGKGYRPESYRYAASSSFAPYHNTGGSTCNICGGTTDHYHYRCTTCKRH